MNRWMCLMLALLLLSLLCGGLAESAPVAEVAPSDVPDARTERGFPPLLDEETAAQLQIAGLLDDFADAGVRLWLTYARAALDEAEAQADTLAADVDSVVRSLGDRLNDEAEMLGDQLTENLHSGCREALEAIRWWGLGN